LWAVAHSPQIIGDIHNVQKDINMASDKLKRTEAVADERIYQVRGALLWHRSVCDF